MKKLEEFKRNLALRATAVYMDRADDLELTYIDFRSHFENLGEILLEIRLIENLTQLVAKISSNEFSQIGIFAEDLEDFLFENK